MAAGDEEAAGGTSPGSRRESRRRGRQWIDALPDGEPCAFVGRLTADALGAARRAHGSAHDHTRDTVLALLRAGETGHPGVPDALDLIRREFIATVRENRGSDKIAASEFDHFTEDGAAKILDDRGERAGRGCDCPSAASEGAFGRSGHHSGPIGQGTKAGRNGHDGGQRIRLTAASGITLRRTEWLWDGRIPAGAFGLFGGREGIGKSLTQIWLTARLTTGALPGRYFGTPRVVLYAAAEDSWSKTVAPRLVAAGADLDLVFRVDVEEVDGSGGALVLPRDVAAVAEEARRVAAVLLNLDPLMSVIAAGIDTHRDRELRTALEPLSALGEDTGCAALGLVHHGKGAATDPLSLVLGSRAFTAVSRYVLAAARDPDAHDGSCVLSLEKNNLGRLDVPSLRYVIDDAAVQTADGPAQVGALRFVGEADRTVGDILQETALGIDRGERDEAADWLVGYLTDHEGEARASEILKAARADGIAERTLRRARSRAGVESRRSGFGQGALWRLAYRGHSGRSGQVLCPGNNGRDGGRDDGDDPPAAEEGAE